MNKYNPLHFYNNLNVRTKLYLFSGCLVVWFIVIGGFSVWSSGEIAEGITEAKATGDTTTLAAKAERSVFELQAALSKTRGVDDPEAIEEIIPKIKEMAASVQKAVKATDSEKLSVAHSEKSDALLKEATAEAENLVSLTEAYTKSLATQDEKVFESYNSVGTSLKKLDKLMVEVNGIVKADGDTLAARDFKVFRILTVVLCSLVSVAILSLLLFAYLLTRSISVQLDRISKTVLQVKEGNLTSVIEVKYEDDLSVLSHGINDMVAQTRLVIANLITSTKQVEKSAETVLRSSEQVATAAEEISCQANTVATASEEMAATAHEVANNCQMVAESVSVAESAAFQGSSVTQQAVNQMTEIVESTENTVRTVELLAQRSDEIGEIVSTIDDIADQTNLLALNAAIEAARAGDAGRGFAVVADEVRKLSDRTTAATKEIAQKIKDIQTQTKETIDAIRGDSTKIRVGGEEVTSAGSSMSQILDQIGNVNGQVSQIATAAEEQSAVTSEITTNIHQISEVVAHAAEQSQASAQESKHLIDMIVELEHLVSRFNVGNIDVAIMVETARRDHIAFVEKVKKGVSGEIPLSAKDLPDHHNCRFGKWYDEQANSPCASKTEFVAINSTHAKIHELAKQAIGAKGSKKANDLLKEIDSLSAEIGDRLSILEKTCR